MKYNLVRGWGAILEDTCYGYKMKEKTCTRCNTLKATSQFSISKNRKIRVQSWCKDCFKGYVASKGGYETADRKQRRKETKTLRKDRNRRYLTEYLRHQKCKDCGIQDFRVLELQSRVGVERSVSELVNHAFGLKTFSQELQKYDIVCANCSRIRGAHLSALGGKT